MGSVSICLFVDQCLLYIFAQIWTASSNRIQKVGLRPACGPCYIHRQLQTPHIWSCSLHTTFWSPCAEMLRSSLRDIGHLRRVYVCKKFSLPQAELLQCKNVIILVISPSLRSLWFSFSWIGDLSHSWCSLCIVQLTWNKHVCAKAWGKSGFETNHTTGEKSAQFFTFISFLGCSWFIFLPPVSLVVGCLILTRIFC